MPRVHRASGNRVSAGFTASAELSAVQKSYRIKYIVGSVLNFTYITLKFPFQFDIITHLTDITVT